jgi:hypothetical protein
VQTAARKASTAGSGDGGCPVCKLLLPVLLRRLPGGCCLTRCHAGEPPSCAWLHRSSAAPGGTLQMSEAMKVARWGAVAGCRRPARQRAACALDIAAISGGICHRMHAATVSIVACTFQQSLTCGLQDSPFAGLRRQVQTERPVLAVDAGVDEAASHACCILQASVECAVCRVHHPAAHTT